MKIIWGNSLAHSLGKLCPDNRIQTSEKSEIFSKSSYSALDGGSSGVKEIQCRTELPDLDKEGPTTNKIIIR